MYTISLACTVVVNIDMFISAPRRFFTNTTEIGGCHGNQIFHNKKFKTN